MAKCGGLKLGTLSLLYWYRFGDGVEESLKIAVTAALARLQDDPARLLRNFGCVVLEPTP